MLCVMFGQGEVLIILVIAVFVTFLVARGRKRR
jgi:hypothetical protein